MHQMERTVVIRANPETVFRFFTDSARWAAWWGTGSTIDAKPGGKVYIRHPNNVETLGEVIEVREPEQISFTYGNASQVTITLKPDEQGTRLHLLHEFEDAAQRDQHVQGWRFQLSLFSNAVSNELYADAALVIDAWFAAWVIADSEARDATLSRIAAPDISFRDRFSLLDGHADLTAHIAAAQRFMPGIRLERKGAVRQCQGTVLAEWIAVDGDGKQRLTGTSVFLFNPDKRINSVISVANI